MTQIAAAAGEERLRELSVFINCPFDDEFQVVFDAIVFATVCCGFYPRCATESGAATLPRMQRICIAMRESKYSIHDLSRCTGEGELNLARFNMPFELGMAMTLHFNVDPAVAHDWLMLVPKGHAYKRVLSDLAGYDPQEYDSSPETVVPAVMTWLATRPEADCRVRPLEVLAALPQFMTARADLDRDWCGQTPWIELVALAFATGQSCGLIPTLD